MIVNRRIGSEQPEEYDDLEQHLADQLNVTLDWPKDSSLTVQLVARIAAATACDVAYSQAANGHLIDLFAALPLPGTAEGRSFWDQLGDAGGNAALNLDPANMGGPFFDRLRDGNEAGIASRVLSFLEELTPSQRTSVAEVIGSSLNLGVSGRYGGELWLRDAERCAWQVALAGRRQFETPQDRERFFEAWRRA